MTTRAEQNKIDALMRETAANRQKLAELTREHNHGMTVKNFANPAEEAEFQRITQQFDYARQAHRLPPIRPLNESSAEYLRRQVNSLAPHTLSKETRAPLDGSVLKGGPAWLALHAARVVDSAMESAHRAPDLRQIKTIDQTGREILEFVGNKNVWLDQFRAPVLAGVVTINGVPGTF
jgi:hypothetical protein